MKASIEIDVLVHVGNFLNIDLLERGLYLIEITLLYGLEKKRITPVGLFSSPSHYDSLVGDVVIKGGGMLSPCEVDEDNFIFRSRSFIIKYRGEKHELNEGVQWRINLPSYTMEKDAPLCPDLLFVQFGLIHQNVEENQVPHPLLEGETKIEYNITSPREVVSVQMIGLQSVGSGFHQFFPIHFDGNYCVTLDTMIHACVSNITYHHPTHIAAQILKPPPPPPVIEPSPSRRRSSAPKKSEPPEYEPPPLSTPPPAKRMSTIIDPPIFDPNGSIFDGNYVNISALMGKFSRRSSKTVRIENSPPPPPPRVDSQSILPTSDPSLLTDYDQLYPFSSITEKQWKKIIRVLFNPILKNYEIAIQQSQFIHQLYALWKDSNTDHSPIDSQLPTPLKPTTPQSNEISSIIPSKLQEIYEKMMKQCVTFTEGMHYFEKEMLSYNTELSINWSLLFNSCRKVVHYIRNHLFQNYFEEMNAFWKQQMMIHTRSFLGSERLSSRKDIITLSTLEDHIEMERNNDQDVQQSLLAPSTALTTKIILSSPNTSHYHNSGRYHRSNEENEDDEEEEKNTQKGIALEDVNFGLYPRILARGMKVFDVTNHMYPSKTAYLFMEKYMNDQSTMKIDKSLNSLESKLLDSNSNEKLEELDSINNYQSEEKKYSHQPVIFTGTHVIILQHGFLGSGYDMRLFYQAIKILCPTSNVHVHTMIANEHSSQETLSTMGKTLRNELLQLLEDQYPEFLEKDFYQNEFRISFIAHSMGGLIVRSALQEKELTVLHNKLHLFISLAVPHLGNCFPESSLVSTGMWALSKFKNCVSLKELVFEDVTITNGREKEKEHSKETEVKKSSYLYKLSEQSCFAKFYKIILVSSPKDQYVPFYSARLQITPKIEQSSQANMISQMIDNLLQSLSADQFIRMTLVNNINYNINAMQQAIQEYSALNHLVSGGVNPSASAAAAASIVINIPGSGNNGGGNSFDINNMIGRTAHICYLENPAIPYQIIQSLLPYFIYDYYPH